MSMKTDVALWETLLHRLLIPVLRDHFQLLPTFSFRAPIVVGISWLTAGICGVPVAFPSAFRQLFTNYEVMINLYMHVLGIKVFIVHGYENMRYKTSLCFFPIVS